MKSCVHCSRQVAPGADTYVGTVVYPGMVVCVFTHSSVGCSGTYGCLTYDVPDELDLVDGNLGPLAHGRDSREVEAA